MLDIKEVVVSYKERKDRTVAVGPVSFSLEKGKIAVILGPSGCGKSTLMQYLAGIMACESGSSTLNEKVISYQEDCIGYMPQGYGLLPWKTVYQNCLLPYKVKKITFSEERKVYVEHLLKVLGLDEMKNRYPISLSGGQRQRAAIARTLGMRPELLLMDEPFSALDAVMKEEAEAAFLQLWEEVHCTTLIVSHSIEEALYLGEKIIVIGERPGRIIEVIDNPWFGRKEAYDEAGYYQLRQQLKQKIKRGWQHA